VTLSVLAFDPMSDCCDKKNQSIETQVNLGKLEEYICFCFKKSKKELFVAVKGGVEGLIIEDIKSKMKDPGCFCETSNPSGQCCLSDIQAFIKTVKASG
jgi:hypothetical protein